MFTLVTAKTPSGSQPEAIEKLCNSISNNEKNQLLLGVTGSGKTFTMANVIAKLNRPSLIMAPNKVLAAQIYREMQVFFPHNAVEYFISYYDYFQPEAYIPSSNKYIEKDCSINKQIDSLRHSSTVSLLTRRDTIVVASVSCIYGVGTPEAYLNSAIILQLDQQIEQQEFIDDLLANKYERTSKNIPGAFLQKENQIRICPSHSCDIIYHATWNDTKTKIQNLSITRITDGAKYDVEKLAIFANSHYVCDRYDMPLITGRIEDEMKQRAEYFRLQGKYAESERIESRTSRDLTMLNTTGMCKGIENYSMYIANKNPGDPPTTLFSYLPEDGLLFVDESHITVSQIQSMSEGNKSRKRHLIEHGFRLPSSIENRPMTFKEWDEKRPQTIFVTATPGKYEYSVCRHIAEQIIRPTGLIEPPCEIRSKKDQASDIQKECLETKKRRGGALVMCLTKQAAENIVAFLTKTTGIAAEYMHADTKILDRVLLLEKFRSGEIDVIVGINLLREGIDLPDCDLVIVMDADKTGFLRSSTALIQMIGRAARNSNSRVILYADEVSSAIKDALKIIDSRRKKQIAFNTKNGVTPTQIQGGDYGYLLEMLAPTKTRQKIQQIDGSTDIEKLNSEMERLAHELKFEEAEKILLQIDIIKTQKRMSDDSSS